MKKYLDDINYLISEIERMHPNPYLLYKKESFYRDLEELSNKELTDLEFKYYLAEIVAKLGDQHTCIRFMKTFLWDIKLIDNKLYVVCDYRNKKSIYLHKYIKSINGILIDNIIEQLIKIIPCNIPNWNKAMVQDSLLSRLFLKSINVIKEDEFNIELDDGTIVDVNKETKKEIIKFPKLFDHKNISEETFYIKYERCRGSEPNEVETFFEEVQKTIDNNNFKNIIVDLRGNFGGNSRYFTNFSNFLNQKYKDLNYYTLIDESVFSSGSWALNDLIKLNSISLGNTPGAYKDTFGEVKIIELPNTKIKCMCSIKYFKYENDHFEEYTKDNINEVKEYLYEFYEPDIMIKPTIDDYKENNDVALNTALDYIQKKKHK